MGSYCSSDCVQPGNNAVQPSTINSDDNDSDNDIRSDSEDSSFFDSLSKKFNRQKNYNQRNNHRRNKRYQNKFGNEYDEWNQLSKPPIHVLYANNQIYNAVAADKSFQHQPSFDKKMNPLFEGIPNVPDDLGAY